MFACRLFRFIAKKQERTLPITSANIYWDCSHSRTPQWQNLNTERLVVLGLRAASGLRFAISGFWHLRKRFSEFSAWDMVGDQTENLGRSRKETSKTKY